MELVNKFVIGVKAALPQDELKECICQPIFRSYDHRKLGHLTSKFSVGDSDAFMFNYYYIQYSP